MVYEIYQQEPLEEAEGVYRFRVRENIKGDQVCIVLEGTIRWAGLVCNIRRDH